MFLLKERPERMGHRLPAQKGIDGGVAKLKGNKMNVESINISQKSLTPGARKALPAGKATRLKEENVEKPVQAPDSSQVKALVADVKNNLTSTDLHFSVNQPDGKIKVTVTEKSSGKVIREIPSSEMQKLAANMDEMIGMIFDKKG